MKLSDSEIQFCDNHILVAVKPAGLLTQPNGTKDPSLEAFLKEWVKKEYKKPGNVFLHAVHRLDRPVSGLVLFARTSKALSRLNELQRNLEIQRIYIAEVMGQMPFDSGKLDHYLIHGDHKALIGKEGDPDAKHARLSYEVVRRNPHSTHVRVELETGRYHQIRAQFSASGHPILGDAKYGAKGALKSGIHLHSFETSFRHPTTKELLTFKTPPPF